LASILRAKGKLEEATSLANEIMRTNEGDISALVLLTALAQEQGNCEKAKQHSREIQTIEADFSIAAYLARQPYRDENIPKGLRELLLKAGLL